MAQNFIFQNHQNAFFWSPIDHTMSIDKHIEAFSPIESKKFPIHEEFDETNSKHEKKRNLIQAKKAPR